jgi:hypothetical protein
MSEQSGFPPHFRVLFESVLQTYEKKTGVILAEHPLTVQLHRCHSVESITTVLEGQSQHLTDFPGGDRIMRSIQNTVSILTRLSSAAFGLVTSESDGLFHISLTRFLQDTPTCESNTRWSRRPTCPVP